MPRLSGNQYTPDWRPGCRHYQHARWRAATMEAVILPAGDRGLLAANFEPSGLVSGSSNGKG